jgi:hypothetical protein
LASHRDELERWIEAASFGPASRKVYVLERVRPLAEVVDLRRADTLMEAFACADCGGDIEATTALVCLDCGRRYSPDARGILSFVPQTTAAPVVAVPVVPAPAGPVDPATPAAPVATFSLAPRWLEDLDWVAPVHNYLVSFPADAPCVLRLLADPAEIDAEEAVNLLNPLLSRFEDGRFPAIELTATLDDEGSGGMAFMLPTDAEGMAAWTPQRFMAQFARASARLEVQA